MAGNSLESNKSGIALKICFRIFIKLKTCKRVVISFTWRYLDTNCNWRQRKYISIAKFLFLGRKSKSLSKHPLELSIVSSIYQNIDTRIKSLQEITYCVQIYNDKIRHQIVMHTKPKQAIKHVCKDKNEDNEHHHSYQLALVNLAFINCWKTHILQCDICFSYL